MSDALTVQRIGEIRAKLRKEPTVEAIEAFLRARAPESMSQDSCE